MAEKRKQQKKEKIHPLAKPFHTIGKNIVGGALAVKKDPKVLYKGPSGKKWDKNTKKSKSVKRKTVSATFDLDEPAAPQAPPANPIEEFLNSLGGMGGGPSEADINTIVSGKFAAKKAGLENALRQLAQQVALDTKAAERTRDIQDRNISDIYGGLGNQLTQLNQATGENYRQGSQEVAEAYNRSIGDVGKAGQGLQAQLAAQAQQLGLGAAIPQASQGILDSLTQQQAALAQSRGESEAGMGQLGSILQGLGANRIAVAGQEGARSRSDLANRTASNMGDIRLEGARKSGDLRAELASIAAEAAGERASLKSSRGGRETDPLSELSKRIGIAKGMQDLGLLPGGEKPPAELVPGTGRLGLQTFYGTPGSFWKKQAGPKFQSAIEDILGQSMNDEDIAYSLIPEVLRRNKKLNPQAIRQALEVYFGNFGSPVRKVPR